MKLIPARKAAAAVSFREHKERRIVELLPSLSDTDIVTTFSIIVLAVENKKSVASTIRDLLNSFEESTR